MNNEILVTKLFTFEAAHRLPKHEGKCARLHGHSYKLEVTIGGTPKDTGSEEGMVMDFAELSRIVGEEVIQPFDHQFLNDLFDFPTTVEMLTQEIGRRISSRNIPLREITLWETATCKATIRYHAQ